MYSYYIYICLSKYEKRLSSNDTTLLLLFKIEPFDNNNFKQKRVNAYALKKKEKRARSL